MAAKESFTEAKTAIIIGGSLAGLMHGIMLRDSGWSVRILERSPTSSPMSHMAGVCLAPDVLAFLRRFDRLYDKHEIGIPATCLQTLRPNGRVFVFKHIRRIMTSWDALYFRLRANFDGLTSEFTGNQKGHNLIALSLDEKNRAIYNFGMNVVEIDVQSGRKECPNGKVVVHADCLKTGERQEFHADRVLGADGPSSIVRRTFLPNIERQYVGYIAWRGIVPESRVSEATRRTFAHNITYSCVNGGHIIVYNIPGEKGSTNEGERILNFCWYSNESAADLEEIMTDINGTRHRTSVPPGLVRPEVWGPRQKLASANYLPAYVEIIQHIWSPFIHVISEYRAPQVSFHDGRILLVGDSSALLRPHIAFSTGQAAYECLMVENHLIKGALTAQELDWQVTNFTATHVARSIWFGNWFQQPLYLSLQSAVVAWSLQAIARLRFWLGLAPAPRD